MSSFEDKCSIIGVVPLISGLCIATEGGASGTTVPAAAPARRTIPPVVERGASRRTLAHRSAWSRMVSQTVVDPDEMFARALQA